MSHLTPQVVVDMFLNGYSVREICDRLKMEEKDVMRMIYTNHYDESTNPSNGWEMPDDDVPTTEEQMNLYVMANNAISDAWLEDPTIQLCCISCKQTMDVEEYMHEHYCEDGE